MKSPRDANGRTGTRVRRSRRGGLALAIIAGAASATGCGREFFREWADQDVAEVVFEKSRDPRFFIDTFSVEPPAMSRFADPTDPDFPPAPPDDHATAALCTAPQWPAMVLLTPMEGTGYIDMLEAWDREKPRPPSNPARQPAGVENPNSSTPPGPRNPPPSTTPSPFQPGVNSGPKAPATSPIPSRDTTPPSSPRPNSGPGNVPPPAGTAAAPSQRKDSGVLQAAFQAPVVPQPNLPGDSPQGRTRGRLNLPANTDPQTGLTREQYKPVGEEEVAAVGAMKVDVTAFDEAEAAGLPPGSHVYILNPPQTLQLALINNRTYQFHLENLYQDALPVAAARFALGPQFEAGFFPKTSPQAGGLGSNPIDSFSYANRDAPGGQRSGLNLGTAAGVGKVFSWGGQLVASFANSIVFNFLSKTSAQPNVSSLMPLTYVQPFLKGGGRAVTLENLSFAERTLIYECRNFARFRQEWIPYIFGNAQPVDAELPAGDPNIGYLQVIQQLQDIENDQQTLASFRRFFKLYQESLGGGSGISQLQVDQMEQQVQNTLQTLITDEIQYRSALEQFRYQIGIPPDVPVVLDRGLFLPIRKVFFEIEAWSKLDDKIRDNDDLSIFVEKLPKLADVVIDGRPVVAYFAKPELREDVLQAAERVSLENRLDLMNNRATLYDLWRQYAVNANALKGVFTVTLTNTYSTPTTTTNPMGFLDNARNFQMVLSTELPLIRMAQRNTYRNGIINYRRGQRNLMFQEDAVKYNIRNLIRQLVVQGQTWEIQKRILLLTLRQRDNAQRQISAPPANANADTSALVTANTTNVINAQTQLLQAQTRIILAWITYETLRMQIYRDLGTMPYDEWEAFYEFFPPEPGAPRRGPVANAGSAAARPAANANVAAAERR